MLTSNLGYFKLKETQLIKLFLSRCILVFFDIACIAFALYLAYVLRLYVGDFPNHHTVIELSTFIRAPLIYSIVLVLFLYEGIYTNRYDFWHESYLILKMLIYSLVIVLAYLGITKTIQEYSRFIILVSFFLMALLIPLAKNIIKKFLFRMGYWQRKAKIYGDKDYFLEKEVFENHYLGYVQVGNEERWNTVFINSLGFDAKELRLVIEREIGQSHEVVFVPLVNDYDFSESPMYLLNNSRTNLFILENRLKSRFRQYIKQVIDIGLLVCALPLFLLVCGLIALLIKKEEPRGTIFFNQNRLGKDGTVFQCYKFRTMYEKSEQRLQDYLVLHPEEIGYYATYHKYKNDPRITKIGAFLRKTSLDELPQLVNVVYGEMSFIGPRPYMLNEAKKMEHRKDIVLSVKPGISGLWQVNGRNNVDFMQRLELDIWYVRNWSIWLDITIILKTIKVVLLRNGAR